MSWRIMDHARQMRVAAGVDHAKPHIKETIDERGEEMRAHERATNGQGVSVDGMVVW